MHWKSKIICITAHAVGFTQNKTPYTFTLRSQINKPNLNWCYSLNWHYFQERKQTSDCTVSTLQTEPDDGISETCIFCPMCQNWNMSTGAVKHTLDFFQQQQKMIASFCSALLLMVIAWPRVYVFTAKSLHLKLHQTTGHNVWYWWITNVQNCTDLRI